MTFICSKAKKVLVGLEPDYKNRANSAKEHIDQTFIRICPPTDAHIITGYALTSLIKNSASLDPRTGLTLFKGMGN
jgi:hypothetical protein